MELVQSRLQLSFIQTIISCLLMLTGAAAAWGADASPAPASQPPESTPSPVEPAKPVEPPKPSESPKAADTPAQNPAPAKSNPTPSWLNKGKEESSSGNPKPVTTKPTGYDEAVKLYNSKKYAAAVLKLEQAVKDGSADDDTHLYLAASYRALKQWDKTIAEYNWLAKHAKSVTKQRAAESEAYTLTCYRKGICPGHCLKATDPGWHHMQVSGHGPEELWMTFPYNGGTQSWSQHHLGQVIEYVNGMPVNKGVCPICNGTGRVTPLK